MVFCHKWLSNFSWRFKFESSPIYLFWSKIFEYFWLWLVSSSISDCPKNDLCYQSYPRPYYGAGGSVKRFCVLAQLFGSWCHSHWIILAYLRLMFSLASKQIRTVAMVWDPHTLASSLGLLLPSWFKFILQASSAETCLQYWKLSICIRCYFCSKCIRASFWSSFLNMFFYGIDMEREVICTLYCSQNHLLYISAH